MELLDIKPAADAKHNIFNKVAAEQVEVKIYSIQYSIQWIPVKVWLTHSLHYGASNVIKEFDFF